MQFQNSIDRVETVLKRDLSKSNLLSIFRVHKAEYKPIRVNTETEIIFPVWKLTIQRVNRKDLRSDRNLSLPSIIDSQIPSYSTTTVISVEPRMSAQDGTNCSRLQIPANRNFKGEDRSASLQSRSGSNISDLIESLSATKERGNAGSGSRVSASLPEAPAPPAATRLSVNTSRDCHQVNAAVILRAEHAPDPATQPGRLAAENATSEQIRMLRRLLHGDETERCAASSSESLRPAEEGQSRPGDDAAGSFGVAEASCAVGTSVSSAGARDRILQRQNDNVAGNVVRNRVPPAAAAEPCRPPPHTAEEFQQSELLRALPGAQSPVEYCGGGFELHTSSGTPSHCQPTPSQSKNCDDAEANTTAANAAEEGAGHTESTSVPQTRQRPSAQALLPEMRDALRRMLARVGRR